MSLLLLLILAAPQSSLRVELLLGGAMSLPSTLALEQPSFPPLEVDADWAGRSLEGPLYYALRVSRSSAERAWALVYIHHKLYLVNTPPEVAAFSISHGYNLLTLERGWKVSGFWLWAGAGLVIAHPESTVRGLTWDQTGGLFGGYFLTGPTLAAAASRRIPLGARFDLGLEARFTASWARVPIVEGTARAPDRSLHLLAGLGFRF